jgi:sugar porter (SP) family MFS transporter
MKLNSYLLRSTIVGALGGLLFGFDTAVIAGTTHSLTSVFGLSAGQLGFTVSAALWGTVIGAMFAGIPGQRFGGRETLRITAVLYVISAVGCALAWNWPALVLFRFVGGLGIGASSVVGPVYLAELAPAKLRGRLVGVFQINIVVGILLAYFSNYLVGRAELGAREWRWDLGVAAVPAALFLILLFTIPRSPRWLAAQGRLTEAGSVLQQLGSPDPGAQLQEIAESIHLDAGAGSEPLFQIKYRRLMFLAVSLAMFNQLSGINAILYYLNHIFESAGSGKLSGDLQAVAIGAMNLLATLVAMTVIDRLGRKKLLLTGTVGMSVCLGSVAAIFARHHHNWIFGLLLVYIAFFALSQGAVVWVYLSEIFPTRVRAKGQSLGSSTHWIMNALISGAFPIVAQHSVAYPFVFFAAMMAVQFFVVLWAFPETKAASLEQLSKRLVPGG